MVFARRIPDNHLADAASAAAVAAFRHLPERMRFVVAAAAAVDSLAAVAGLALAVRFQSSALHR